VIGRAGGQTTGQLRAATRRAVLAADPAAADRRREEARKDARVETWSEHSGTAALAGRDLPPADVLAADRRIDTLARQLKTAGATVTLDVLRARVYTALLLGIPIRTLQAQLLPPQAAAPGQDPAPATQPDGNHPAGGEPGRSQSGSGRPAGGRSGSGRSGSGRSGSSQSGSSQPGGSQPGGSQSGSSESGSSESGGQSGGQSGRGEPAGGRPAGSGSAGDATPGSGNPGSCPGPATQPAAQFPDPPLAGSVNLTMPLSTWLGGSAPGEVPGFGPIPGTDAQALARLLAAQPGTRWCLTLTGSDGSALAHGCARPGVRGDRCGQGQDPNGPGQVTGNAVSAQELTITIKPLAGQHCQHEHESRGYRPSGQLRHLVTIRQRRCSFPGCRNAAIRCDLDHTTPYHLGGRTCSCNLAPLCRRHHQAKQAQGWHLDQPEPGVLTWTLPHGRSYQVRPDPYPAGGP
jgi:hypothetical protein